MHHAPADMLADADALAIIARGLRSPHDPFPTSIGLGGDALVATAAQHRVLVLLGSLLRSAGTLAAWPPEFVDAFRQADRQAVALDCARHAELRRVLAALESRQIAALVLKGAALAHVCYPAPHLRPHTDTDLLVRAADAPALNGVFASLGYERQQEPSGRLMSYQSHYGRADRHDIFHAFDMHWKISNRQALADRLTFDELWDGRIPVPSIGPSAATVDPVHALILALVHRAGHHPGSRDLLWIYDLHLLAGALTEQRRAEFEVLAAARGLAAIVAEGLALSREWFGTPVATGLIDALGRRPSRADDVSVIRGMSSQTDLLYMDLRALATWRQRARLVREHLLPAPAYIRAKYGLRSNLLLPVFYAWRAVAGAPKWLSRRETAQ